MMDSRQVSKDRRLQLVLLAGQEVGNQLATARLCGFTADELAIYVSNLATALLSVGASMEGEEWVKRTPAGVDEVLQREAQAEGDEQAGMN